MKHILTRILRDQDAGFSVCAMRKRSISISGYPQPNVLKI